MTSSGGNEQMKDILDRSFAYLQKASLRPFLLSLPLHGPSARSNQNGIRDKIMKNRSFVVTPQNPFDESTRDAPDSVSFIHQVVDRLTTNEIVGFVLVVAEYLGSGSEPPDLEAETITTAAYQYRPVAGGIVELLDEHERAIRGLWCRRSLPESVAETLLRVTTMRLVAHAFEWQHPSNPTKRINSKLVSSLEVHSLTFPQNTYLFLTTAGGLNLSKHWETPEDGGAHNDSPNQRCKCFKLADKPEAWQFWGISESRFLKAWNAKKEFLIPDAPAKDIVELFNNSKGVQSATTSSFKRVGEGSRENSTKKHEAENNSPIMNG